MKRIVTFTMLVASTSATLACETRVLPPHSPGAPVDSTVRRVLVSPEQATVKAGDSLPLAASVDAGAAVTDRSVRWSSSNTTIASVSANGIVTPGTGTGTVTITAKSNADTTVKGTSVITVSAAAAILSR